MPASIVLTGISSDYPNPGNFIEVNFSKGRAAGYQGTRAAILLANATASGVATRDTKIYGPDTDIPLQTEDDVIRLGGPGSEAHRGWLLWTLINQRTPLYVIFVTESVGAKATLDFTFVNAATASGYVRFWCGDEYVDCGITSGDAIATIAAALRDKINAKTSWPITATAASGVTTVTAKQNGLRGNEIKAQANIFTNGTIATTVTNGTATALSGGATADSNTTALATLLAKHFYHIVSAATDTTQFGALMTQVGTQALPLSGNRQRVFAGAATSVSAANAIAIARNDVRSELAWQKNSDYTPFEIACHEAAAVALYEAGRAPRPLHNFSGFGKSATTSVSWKLKAPRSGSAPTSAEIESALKNGVTPIGALQNGTSYIVKRITTRSLNGATADYRTRDAHKVTVCDFFADDLQVAIDTAFEGKDITDDVPEGSSPQAGEGVNPDAVTPKQFKSLVFFQIDTADANGQLQRVQEIKDNTVVQRELVPDTRMSARVPLQPISIFDQAAVAIDQVA
jgi:phage tail sheath gpL-like